MNREVLQEAVNKVVQQVNPERIYLFGSTARGQRRSASDLDVLVVENGPFGPERPRWRELSRIRRALADVQEPKDVLLFTVEEFNYWKDSPNHVIGDCVREGVLLYARS